MPENRNPDGSSKKPESFESQFKRRVVKTTKPEHKEKGYNCFFSIQTSKKRNAVKRLTKIIDDDLGYRLLPGLYQTSSNSILGWQNVSATTDKIDLPYKSIH